MEIGNALKNYLESESSAGSSSFDVFAVYVEIAQNIRRYAFARGYGDSDASSTVVVSRDVEGRYVIAAGNVVERADGESLLRRLDALAAMDKAALKAAYKEQLRKPRAETSGPASAGLGLIDMARKASAPLSGHLHPMPGRDQYFFSLRVVI